MYTILYTATHGRRLLLLLLLKKGCQCKAGRERLTLYQPEDTSFRPRRPTHRMKEEKGKQQETKRAARPIKIHWPCSETRQSHTIEYGVTKIVSQIFWQGNKSSAILGGPAARRRISVPMCDHSTACNTNQHIRLRQSTIMRVHQITPDLVQHT